MTGINPLDLSPYLTLPRRDVRTACRALIRHIGRRMDCRSCVVADLCRKSVADKDRTPPRRSTCRENRESGRAGGGTARPHSGGPPGVIQGSDLVDECRPPAMAIR